MTWRAGWPYLLAAGVCLGLLVSFAALVAPKDQGVALVPVPVGKAREVTGFPEDFGSLGELVPFAGGVAPIAAEVVPVAHAPEFRDAAWVAAQEPSAFTLQVLAARDEEVVKRFLASREDRADFAYFVFPQPDGIWFVLTTGRYVTHEMAASIAGGKDFGGLSTRAFPRRLSVYQDALKAAELAPGTPSP